MKSIIGLPLFLILSTVLLLTLAACGQAAEPPTEAPVPTATTAPTQAMAEPTATPAEQMEEEAMSGDGDLVAVAAKLASGPGAIYAGDLSQLVGPAPGEGLGSIEDNSVPLDSLERHEWIYESDYYQKMLEKANLTNPTPLTTSSDKYEVQYSCVNRSLLPCKLVESYFIPNLKERTDGQLIVNLTSYPELGIPGTDNMTLIADGVLGMTEIYTGFVAGEVPALEIQSLWGMFPDHISQYDVTTALTPDLERMVIEESGGSFIIMHNWYVGIDQFFFCNEPLNSLDDFKGKKTRSHGAAISDWIEGMGADAQFVTFAEVYTALERGILDCGVTGADPAYGQRWYEVTKYMNGPLISLFNDNVVINKDIWAELPNDLQQIFLEEGAKQELEALRLAAIQNEVGVPKNVNEGMIVVEFSDELQAQSDKAVLENVLPGWINRVGDLDHPIIDIFNEKVAPVVGIRIEDDGTVVKTN